VGTCLLSGLSEQTARLLEAFWKLINWEIIEKRYNEFTAIED